MKSRDHSSSHSAADTAGILLDTFNVQLEHCKFNHWGTNFSQTALPFSMFSEPANVLNPLLLGIF